MPIDHLVYTAPDLRTGMDAIERLLGVRPVPGGQHPHWGTHNALLSLGDRMYLEVLAPDPSLPAPPQGRWLADQCREGPHLSTWAVGTTDIHSLAEGAQRAGLALGPVQSGSRSRANGSVLSWQLTDPYALPFDGLCPFLIDWGDTPHPADNLPEAGKLIRFTIAHPRPAAVQAALQTLGIAFPVQYAAIPMLTAQIDGKVGTVILQ